MPKTREYFKILEENGAEDEDEWQKKRKFSIDNYYIDYMMRQHHLHEKVTQPHRPRVLRSKYRDLIDDEIKTKQF
jgi:hypothetical protein